MNDEFENEKLKKATQKVRDLKEIAQAFRDMNRNYWDMKKDRTIGGDDYFHCKANYEAVQRGELGEETAKKLGDMKEDFDYWYNQFWKGLSPLDASKDKAHDLQVNKTGRQRAKGKLYSSSREGCRSFRVRGINEKY